MSVNVELNFRRILVSRKGNLATLDYISDYDRSIGQNFPGLESFQKIEPSRYHWVFQRVEQSGFQIQIRFTTKFSRETSHILISPDSSSDKSSLRGRWALQAKDHLTTVSVEFEFNTELPIPFVLKAVAVPLTQKEIGKLFDRYIENLGKALAA